MKGQAALEFLTTYGWAILIILVMIGAISYFGVLNPTKLIPERCSFQPEISCKDYQVKSDGNINLLLKQNTGKTIFVESITCEYQGAPVNTNMNSTSWPPTLPMDFNCNFGGAFNILEGEKIKVNIYINYKKSSTTNAFVHEFTGEIFAKVS